MFICTADPAHACHRFHTWRFPFPQRCDVRLFRPSPAPAPIFDEQAARAKAVEALKLELGGLPQ